MSSALSDIVKSRLVGTLHRLYQRSYPVVVKEPMLHPTPFLFLLNHYKEQNVPELQERDQLLENKVLKGVATYGYFANDTGHYSVAFEKQVTDRVNEVIFALDKAGLDWSTSGGLLQLENTVHDTEGPWAKIIDDLELTGARTTMSTVHPQVFYDMLGTKDRYMGAMRDGELYSEDMKESWKQDGFTVEFPQG